MYRVKNPSLELNWVRNCDKTLVLPEIIIYEDTDFYEEDGSLNTGSGWYYEPCNSVIIFTENDSRELIVPQNNGIIVVNYDSECMDDSNIPETIAHEWRHHWQFFHGWSYDGIGIGTAESYEQDIIDYFAKSVSEMDAFCFSVKNVKCWMTDYWRGLLINSGNGDKLML